LAPARVLCRNKGINSTGSGLGGGDPQTQCGNPIDKKDHVKKHFKSRKIKLCQREPLFLKHHHGCRKKLVYWRVPKTSPPHWVERNAVQKTELRGKRKDPPRTEYLSRELQPEREGNRGRTKTKERVRRSQRPKKLRGRQRKNTSAQERGEGKVLEEEYR